MPNRIELITNHSIVIVKSLRRSVGSSNVEADTVCSWLGGAVWRDTRDTVLVNPPPPPAIN